MPDTSAAANVPVLTPTGDLDLATARSLGTQLSELAGSPGDAVLDLSSLSFMDSVGLAVVLKAVNRFSRQDKCLILVVPPSGNIERLLELTGMNGRVTAVASREEALERASTPR